jgi:hypothetical protein
VLKHSLAESGYITMGRAFGGKLLLVVHMDRRDNIRIINGRAGVNASSMKKASNKSARKTMRDEYDFSRAERGKYARRYADGTNVVVLEPDVAKVFPDSESVNASLRKIIRQRAPELAK